MLVSPGTYDLSHSGSAAVVERQHLSQVYLIEQWSLSIVCEALPSQSVAGDLTDTCHPHLRQGGD